MKLEPRVLRWLLEQEQPAVRYRTLLDLLDRGENDPEVRKTHSEIPTRGWALGILNEQKNDGFWVSPVDLYRPEYSATIWKLMILSDMGLTSKDPRIRKPSELLADRFFQPEDGGFRIPDSSSSRSELCITGNMVTALCQCGFTGDWRVLSALEWFTYTQMEDGGWHCSPEVAFGKGTLDCWEALSSFAAFPRRRWTKRIKRSVEKGVEFYLERELFKQGHRRYDPWFRFHYPVHYYYDILVGLDVITSLGYARDKRLKAPLSILNEKLRADGTWALDAVHPDIDRRENGYQPKGRIVRFALESEGVPSKWITLTALRVLKRVDESRP